jgi:hypothetical protein
LNVTYDDLLPLNMRFGGTSLSMAEIGNLLDTALQGEGDAQQEECVQSDANGCVPENDGGKAEGSNVPAAPQFEPGHQAEQQGSTNTAAMDQTLHGVESVLAASDRVLAGGVEISSPAEQDPLLAALGAVGGDTVMQGDDVLAGLSSKLQSADGFSAEQSALLLAVGVSSIDAIKRRKM